MRGAILNDRPFRTPKELWRGMTEPSAFGKRLAGETEQKATKYQKLSLHEAGQFDMKFHTGVSNDKPTRMSLTGWDRVSRLRRVAGNSRKARIRAKKEAANG